MERDIIVAKSRVDATDGCVAYGALGSIWRVGRVVRAYRAQRVWGVGSRVRTVLRGSMTPPSPSVTVMITSDLLQMSHETTTHTPRKPVAK